MVYCLIFDEQEYVMVPLAAFLSNSSIFIAAQFKCLYFFFGTPGNEWYLLTATSIGIGQ